MLVRTVGGGGGGDNVTPMATVAVPGPKVGGKKNDREIRKCED